ncbi:MAG: tRNA pseudouridine(55) synthase TruB [Phycisphaeraceae bacterium]|nr:tRNA pseudouridine(55) synthase TruB [Phycisphaeraceae bacterium]MCB9848139.1 tRNA pseudouridine(55) synthase TruB [Phycisphaeraceae bacterium]
MNPADPSTEQQGLPPPRHRKRDRPPRNKRPDCNGFLVIDKPLGMSSAYVCTVIRGKSGGAKVGHTGALDPLATGVLVLCLGRATKFVERIMGQPKRYLADIDLSAFSTTEDLEGELSPVEVTESDRPLRDAIEGVLRERFTGVIQQAPPSFSAMKIGGRPAYKLARAGEIPSELQPRPVRIDSIGIVAYAWPKLTLDIRCGRGTYIRSIARDLGRSLGTGGHLTALRRTEVGQFTEDHAQQLETIPEGDHFDQSVLVAIGTLQQD